MNELPQSLREALQRLSEGHSRRDLSSRAAAISQSYRGGGTSKPIAEARDALAYALTRMPATYAGVLASLAALREARPDFAPSSMIDAGAGPGTAAWAAATAFPSLADILLLDGNAALAGLARTLMDADDRLAGAGLRIGSIGQLLAQAPRSDLVIASYLIGELDDRQRTEIVEAMWEVTGDTLLLVEPGTPGGYQRIIAMRARLVALGANVLAPCPHDATCPLPEPDWCHFAQRLPRSRDHLLVKNAAVPFEDEKFSYVALSRVAPATRAARVLAQPRVGKVAVAAKLCTARGIVTATTPRRDKPAFAKARHWRWGDAVSGDFVD